MKVYLLNKRKDVCEFIDIVDQKKKLKNKVLTQLVSEYQQEQNLHQAHYLPLLTCLGNPSSKPSP